MLFADAKIFRQGRLERADLRVSEARIESILPPGTASLREGEELIRTDGAILAPGLTDMHCHGAAGADFSDADPTLWSEFLHYEATEGITQICPATMTLPEDRLRQIMRTLASYQRNAGEAELVGAHLEGPYLSPNNAGCQNPEDLQLPNLDFVKELLHLSGDNVKVMTIAPELAGAEELIRELSGELLVSLGHSTANYETAKRAFELGAGHLTHLFNAMPPWKHREPGPIGAAYEKEEVSVELIADGIHVHPASVKMAFQLFPHRLALVSDSMRACGLTDGRYEFGGQMIEKKGREARLKSGQLAGSVSNLHEVLVQAVRFGVPLEIALEAATEIPARRLSIDHELGVLKETAYANLILLDEKSLSLRAVYLRGELLQRH